MCTHGIRLLSAIAIFAQFACTPSPTGQVEEIVKTSPPTFSGLMKMTFRASSNEYTIKGECDVNSYALQWSYDQSTWTDFPKACQSGNFTLTVNLVSERTVYFRARAKFIYTAVATATVQLGLLPTTASMNFVAAGNADPDRQLGTQFSAEGLTKATQSNSSIVIKTSIIDQIYEH